MTPVTDKNTELSREIKKNPVEKQEPIAPPPPPPQQKPMTFTPASSPSTPVSSEVKSNIPVATKTKKKTGLFVGIAIVVVLIFVSAIYFALKNFVFNKDEAKINAVITPEKPVQLDSNKVKDALNKYLNDIYTKNKITDTTISKAKDFNFVKPVNDKLEPDLYNPFNGTYDVNTNKLNYSNFSLISFSDNKFKAKYNLDNDEWQFVSEISGTTENNNIVIKEVKYSSVLYIGKEENNSASKPVKETTKIVKEKPPKEKDNPPKEKEKEKPPVWKPNAH